MKRVEYAALCLLLTACGPGPGEAGGACKPDGTCIGPNLECEPAVEWLGVPVHEPFCQVKKRKNDG